MARLVAGLALLFFGVFFVAYSAAYFITCFILDIED
jgi:hypothetical protein